MKKKLPVYYQLEENECGFTSLAMILAYYGCPLTLSELRCQTVINHVGLSVNDLIRILSQNKMKATPLLLKAENIKSLVFPAILHWDFNHFVVIKRCNKYMVTIHDPKYGVCRVSWGEFKNKFNGLAIECVQSGGYSSSRRAPSLIQYCKMLFPYDCQKEWLYLFLLYIVNQVLLLTGFIFFFKVFSLLKSASIISTLSIILIFTLILNSSLYMLSVIKNKLQLRYAYERRSDFASNFNLLSVKKLHSLSLPTVNRELVNTGNHINGYLSIVIDMVWYLSASLSCLFVLLYNYFSVGLAVLFFSIILSFVYRSYVKSYEINSNEKIVDDNQLTALLSNLYFGWKSIWVFNRKELFFKKFGNLQYKISKVSLKLRRNQNLFQFINEFVSLAEFIVILFIIYTSNAFNPYLMGEVYVLFLYRQIYNRSFSRLLDRWVQFKELFKFYPYLPSCGDSTPVASYDDEMALLLFPLSAVLNIKHLSYYSEVDGTCMFQNVSLNIPLGGLTVIKGSSGCGKSSFIQVLVGLLPATEGEVMLGCKPLMHYRHHMSVVLQHDRFFYGTIIENITFYECSAVNERVEGLCRSLGVYDVIMRLPCKFNTYISSDYTAGLSGGQLQCIFIIRALYVNPKILFLDEATSHLDPATEAQVIRVIKSLNITCIAISHRSGSIFQADRVIDFDEVRESA